MLGGDRIGLSLAWVGSDADSERGIGHEMPNRDGHQRCCWRECCLTLQLLQIASDWNSERRWRGSKCRAFHVDLMISVSTPR